MAGMDDERATREFREVMARLEPFVAPAEVASCDGFAEARLSLRAHDGGSVNVTFEGVLPSGKRVSGGTRLTVTPDVEVARDSAGAPWGFAVGTIWHRPGFANEDFRDEGETLVTQEEEDRACAGLARAAVAYYEDNPLAMSAAAARTAARRAHQARLAANRAEREAAHAALRRDSAESILNDTVAAFVEAHAELAPSARAPAA